MSKIRITMTATVEYTPKQAYYLPEDRTPERMLAVDLEGAKSDPLEFLSDDCVHIEFVGAVVQAERAK